MSGRKSREKGARPLKWRKRLWESSLRLGTHYWLLKTPLGEVMASYYDREWVAAIHFAGTDADLEIGWGNTDEQAKRSAERNLRLMSARLAKVVAP